MDGGGGTYRPETCFPWHFGRKREKEESGAMVLHVENWETILKEGGKMSPSHSLREKEEKRRHRFVSSKGGVVNKRRGFNNS